MKKFTENFTENFIVIFIVGYKKDRNTWNVTESGKEINIESKVKKLCNTYDSPIVTITERIIKDLGLKFNISKEILFLNNQKLVIVSHSYSAFYGLEIAKHIRIHSLILLDPTVRNESYVQYLKETNRDESYLFNNVSESSVSNKTIVKIMLTKHNIMEKLDYCCKLTKPNICSDVIICDVSHMIHYDQLEKVILLIKTVINCSR